MEPKMPSPLTQKLIIAFEHNAAPINLGDKVSVNPVVAEVASFYEKIRNAMEYQEEEVVFRVAIERILKRRLFFDTDGEKIAEPLIRELAWARYFPDNWVPQSIVGIIARKINLYLRLFREALGKHHLSKEQISDWILQVLSADIALTINPNKDVQILSNFMFHIFQEKIIISGDNENDKNALVFISTKMALAKEDKAFLRYHLFIQYFDRFDNSNFEYVLENFAKGYHTIEKTFKHPLSEQVFTFIKKQSVPFLILLDVLGESKGNLHSLVMDEAKLSAKVLQVCQKKYQDIHRKVRRAIIRSVIFLFATKAIFALVVEGSFERFFYGQIAWGSLASNIVIPPFLMFLSIFFIGSPNRENSLKILEEIRSILFDPRVSLIEEKRFKLHSKRSPALLTIFVFLWVLSLGLGLILVIYILTMFRVNPASQAVFVLFLFIVSFLIFRINQSAKLYNVYTEKESFRTVLFDFFFMPFIQMGRRLTLSFSQINIFLLVIDFLIETPFKTIFAFFEQWFSFLRSQRERLG